VRRVACCVLRIVPVRALANKTAFVAGGEGVGGVFDHGQVVLVGDVQDGVHVAGVAVEMNGQDGFDGEWRMENGEWRMEVGGRISIFHLPSSVFHLPPSLFQDRSLYLPRVYIQRVRLYVYQDGAGADVFDDVDAGTEGHGGGDDGVARADAQGSQGHVHGRRTGVEGQGRRRADESGEFFLEAPDFRPGGDPVRAECVYDFSDFLLADEGWREGEKGVTHLGLLLSDEGLWMPCAKGRSRDDAGPSSQ